ncbi:diphthamide synthesis protein [Candidatus Pacearchaeota archaeon]|nr:diphthamide synthesis protein [Candidatus Pacearchaeota archaeon]
MKVLYIESKLKNLKLNLDKSEIQKLPKKLFLAYSIQYKNITLFIKKQLEANNIKITNMQQVLGCSKIQTKDPILLIGAGRFHAINLYLQAPVVYILENSRITKIPGEDIKKIEKKRKAALMNFLKAEKIGLLITTKPGQENMKIALKLKENLEKKGKNVFLFISNNIDLCQFENFPIDSWVNTACPGLANDNAKIVNYQDVISL